MPSERVIISQRIYASTNGSVDLSKPINISGILANLSYQYNAIPDANLIETSISLENRQIVIPWSGSGLSGDNLITFNEKMEYIQNHFYVINRDEAITLGLVEEFDRIYNGKGVSREDESCSENPCPPEIEVISPVSICDGEEIDLSTMVSTSIEDYTLQIIDGNNQLLTSPIVSPSLSSWYRVKVIGNYETYKQECNSEFGEILVNVHPIPNLILINYVTDLDIKRTTTFLPNISGGSWSSSNTDVATIDPITGLITPISIGTTTITYTYTTEFGCSNSISTELNINDCTPEFELPTEQTVCVNTLVNIRDLIDTEYIGYEIIVRETSTNTNISYVVTSNVPGSITYDVTIVVDGCKSTTKQITIHYKTPDPIIITRLDEPEFIGVSDYLTICENIAEIGFEDYLTACVETCIPEEVIFEETPI